MTTLPDNKELQASARSSIAAPVTPTHEAIIKMVNDLIATQLQPLGLQFGTVTGQDGGAVRVLMDGEDDPRQVGFHRHVGIQYSKGQRVTVGTANTGEKVILGAPSDGTGKAAEAVVGSANLQDGSVQRNHIGNNAVGTTQLDSGAVDTGNVKTNAITNDKLAPSSVDTNNLKGNSVNNAALAPNAVDTSNIKSGAVGSSQLSSGVNSSLKNADSAIQQSDLSSYAKSSDLNAYAKSSDVNKDLNQLSGAKLKVDSSGVVTLPKLSSV